MRDAPPGLDGEPQGQPVGERRGHRRGRAGGVVVDDDDLEGRGTGAELGEPLEQSSERLGPLVRRDADAHRHRPGAAVTGRSRRGRWARRRRARVAEPAGCPAPSARQPLDLGKGGRHRRAPGVLPHEEIAGAPTDLAHPLAVAGQRFQPVGEALGVPRRDQQVGRVQLPENLRGLRLTSRHHGQPAGQIVEQLQGGAVVGRPGPVEDRDRRASRSSIPGRCWYSSMPW